MAWLDAFPGADAVFTATPDLNGQARGKRLPAAKALTLADGKAKMPLSALSVDILGNDVEDSPLVFESGDQDGFLCPTERDAMWMPWLSAPSVLRPMAMFKSDGSPFLRDPRHVLAQVLARFKARGWTVIAATELEFFLFDQSPATPLAARLSDGGDILGLRSLEAYDPFLTELYAASEAMGIPAETATSESGAGQFEVTLTHGEAMRCADNTWFFKMLVKGLAQKHGLQATFAAKPDPDDAGNGLHLHFSVLDAEGRNIFDDGGPGGSDLLKFAVAGCLATMRDATLIFAPHRNSYLRLVPGAHAPTSLCWAYENRTAALRIPDGPGAARRIEHRVAGGDTNPYLLLAAILGSALMGIESGRQPPPPITGNAYEQDHDALAPNWAAAIEVFEASPSMREILGAPLVDQFVCTKRQEYALSKDMTEADALRLCFDRV